MDIIHNGYNIFYTIISHPLSMLFFGITTHFLKELISLKKSTGKLITFHQYWVENPYQSIFSIIGAIIGFVFLNESNQLNAIAAFSFGYFADSMIESIAGRRTTSNLKKLDEVVGTTPIQPPKP